MCVCVCIHLHYIISCNTYAWHTEGRACTITSIGNLNTVSHSWLCHVSCLQVDNTRLLWSNNLQKGQKSQKYFTPQNPTVQQCYYKWQVYTLLPELVHCNMNVCCVNVYAVVQCAVAVVWVMYLSLPQWYTEVLKHNLSWGSWVGFLDSSVLIFCFHLSGEDTPTWCYYGDGFFWVSCLHRCE